MKKFSIPSKLSQLFLAMVLSGLCAAPVHAQEKSLPATDNASQGDSRAAWNQSEPAPAPDLVIAASPQVAPTLLTAGSPTVVQTSIQNIGNRRAGFSVLGYYLSTDATLSSDDVLLGESITTAIAPENLLTVNTNLLVPAGTATGPYYLLGVTDYLNLVRESNDGNNVWAHRLAVAPAGPARAAQHNQASLSKLISQQTDAELFGADLSIVPNPVAHSLPFWVRLSTAGPAADVTLALYTSQGQRLASQHLALAPSQPGQAEFSTANLAAGIYVLYLSGPGLHAVRRVVVE